MYLNLTYVCSLITSMLHYLLLLSINIWKICLRWRLNRIVCRLLWDHLLLLSISVWNICWLMLRWRLNRIICRWLWEWVRWFVRYLTWLLWSWTIGWWLSLINISLGDLLNSWYHRLWFTTHYRLRYILRSTEWSLATSTTCGFSRCEKKLVQLRICSWSIESFYA